MAKTSIDIRLDNEKLKQVIKDAPLKADAAVRATAFHVEGLAKMLSPYMTGANRNSIYTKTSKGTSGSKGAPGELGDILPNAELGEAYVGPSMEYSARLEFGFVGRDALGRNYHQAPRPYLTPAAEQAPSFLSSVLKRMFNE